MENYNTPEATIAPPNYMTLSIISTILGCCSIFYIGFIIGIVGIYFSTQVNPKYREGDLVGANKNSKYAKICAFIALGLFFVNMLMILGTYLFFPEVWAQQMESAQQMVEQMQEQMESAQ